MRWGRQLQGTVGRQAGGRAGKWEGSRAGNRWRTAAKIEDETEEEEGAEGEEHVHHEGTDWRVSVQHGRPTLVNHLVVQRAIGARVAGFTSANRTGAIAMPRTSVGASHRAIPAAVPRLAPANPPDAPPAATALRVQARCRPVRARRVEEAAIHPCEPLVSTRKGGWVWAVCDRRSGGRWARGQAGAHRIANACARELITCTMASAILRAASADPIAS